LYDDWKVKKGEEIVFDYMNRVYPQIDIPNIAKRFNYDCFNFLTNKRTNICVAIAKACNADEIWQAFNDTVQCPNADELINSLLIGSFFNNICDKLNYIPVAEFNRWPEDDVEARILKRYGLIEFKKPKKYVLVVFEYHFPDGLNFWTTHPLAKYDAKTKLNKDYIMKYICKELGEEFYSLENIYLYENFKWDIKKIVSKIPNDNLYEVTTKIWSISKKMKDPHFGEYCEGPGKLKIRPIFSKKIKN